MSVQGFVMSLMHGARGKDAAKALILPYIFGEAVGNQSYPVVESSGSSPLEIENAAAKDMLSFKTNIVPTQDLNGYDKPWPGGGGTNKLPVTADNVVIGKYISNSGVVTSNANNFYVNYYIPAEPSTEYNLTITTPISYCSIMEYDANKEFLTRNLFTCTGSSEFVTETQVFTTRSDTKFVIFGANLDNSAVDLEKVLSYKYQLQTGWFSGFTPYENICPIQGWQTITGWIDGKYGGNIEWNQLGKEINETNFRMMTGTATYENGVATLNPTGNYGRIEEYPCIPVEPNHKYLISVEAKTNFTHRFIPINWRFGTARYIDSPTTTPNEWIEYYSFKTDTSDAPSPYIYLGDVTNSYTEGDVVQVRNFQLFDLTLMFGSGNEPSTLEEFRSLFPADYYPYNTGTTTCVGEVNGDEYRKIPVTFGVLGKNLMNPDVFYTYSNWKKDLVSAPSSATSSGNKGLALDVKVGETYSITLGITSDNFPTYCYLCSASNGLSKRDHEFTNAAYKDNTYTFTAQADTLYYFRLGSTITEASFNTAVGKISYVQLEVGSPTAYEPYTNTVYGGMYDFVTGELTADVSIKDMGDIVWIKDVNRTGVYYGAITNRKPSSYVVMCDTYEVYNSGVVTTKDCYVSGIPSYASNMIFFRDTRFATKEEAIAGTKGAHVAYTLATPLFFQLDPADVKLLKGTNYLWADCGNTASATYPTTVRAEDITLTGVSPLLLANSQAKKMSQCEVGIVATQEGSGDPYPAGGGKNKFNEEDMFHGYFLPSTPDTLTENEAYRTAVINSLPAGTYTWSTTLTNPYLLRLYYDGEVYQNAGELSNFTFTTTTTGKVMVCFRNKDTTDITETFHTQIEQGSTATEWKPFSNIRPVHGVSTLTTTIADNASGTGGTTYSTEFGCMGVNQWDEEWESGMIGWSGVNAADATRIRSKNYIPCLPNTGYYVASPNRLQIFYYNAEKTFISYEPSSVMRATVTTPNECAYIRFYTYDTAYGTTYNHDISINYPSSVTTYQPYTDECFGGTYNELTGGLGQTDDIVDLGSLSWTRNTTAWTNPTFYAHIVGMRDIGSSLCTMYTRKTSGGVSELNDCTYRTGGTEYLYIRDDSCTTLEAFVTKVKGQKLKYELATPINRKYAPHVPESLAGHTYVITNGGGNITSTYKGVDLS